MVFLGGLGTLAGPLVGALLLTPLQQYLTVQFSAQPGASLVAYGSLLLVVVLVLPRGIVPSLREKRMPAWPHMLRPLVPIAQETWRELLAGIRSPRRLPTARGWGIQAAARLSLSGTVLPDDRHTQEGHHLDTQGCCKVS